MTTLTKFPQFPQFPLEIRQKIWIHTLPGPRVLRVVRKSGRPKQYKATPPSYGGHQISILSVNHESRSVAQLHLTPLFGTYWNLEIDAPYIEIPFGDDSKEEVTQIREMRECGALDHFKNIAIDWRIWNWGTRTQTMEFHTMHFAALLTSGYEHPITTLKLLPNIKCCAFVYWDHTLQKDLVKAYVPWSLGPLSQDTTMDMHCDKVERAAWSQIKARREELGGREDVEIKFLAIHSREREYLSAKGLRRQQAGWEMDLMNYALKLPSFQMEKADF